jgi:hypothetical protein
MPAQAPAALADEVVQVRKVPVSEMVLDDPGGFQPPTQSTLNWQR